MNRKQRREMMKVYRKAGMTKTQAKDTANQYISEKFKSGDKCKINFELCVRNPQWKKQRDDFRNWIVAHKDVILTVDKARYNGTEVTFVEDEQEEKFWHKTITLLPVPTATIKLDSGEEKKIVLEGVKDLNDPMITEKVNEALSELTENNNTNDVNNKENK